MNAKVRYGTVHTEHGFIISLGNSKLGNIPSLSVPSGFTCPAGVPCYHDCYARIMEALKPSVANSYQVNYNAMVKEEGWVNLIQDVCAFIEDYAPRYFRWNVGGDIFSYWYLWAMRQVARECPECDFTVYTKQYGQIDKLLDNESSVPENLHVFLSEWNEYKPSNRLKAQFRVAYYQGKEPVEIDHAKICPGKCNKCKLCYTNSKFNVVFLDH